MKKKLLFNFIVIFLFSLFHQPVLVRSDIIFFNSNGNVVDKEKYDKTASNREQMLSQKLSNGYGAIPKNWQDPIKLRKKRIEQWRIMRSHYNPDSLPHKIENPLN
jgi:hypothetical protein